MLVEVAFLPPFPSLPSFSVPCVLELRLTLTLQRLRQSGCWRHVGGAPKARLAPARSSASHGLDGDVWSDYSLAWPIQSSMPRCGSCTQARHDRDHPVFGLGAAQHWMVSSTWMESFPRCPAILAALNRYQHVYFTVVTRRLYRTVVIIHRLQGRDNEAIGGR